MSNFGAGFQDFALAIALLSIAAGCASAAFVWFNRSNARLKARFPTVLVIDLAFGSLHSMNLAFSYTRYFDSEANCQPAASFVEGFEWFAASVFVGRCCLFYMSSRSNGLVGKMPQIIETLMDKLAYCTSSGQYYSMKSLLDLQKQVESRRLSSVNQASTADLLKEKQKKRTSLVVVEDIKEIRSKVPKIRFKFLQGDERLLFCASLWFLFGFFASLIETSSTLHSKENSILSSTECWHKYVRFQTALLFLAVSFVSGLLLYVSSKIQDLVGARTEFMSQFVVILIFKLSNALNLAIALNGFEYFDVIAVFSVPATILYITSFYVFFPPSEELVNNGQMNWKDVERIWLISETGKMKIIDIAKRLYMSESIKFLEATDDITEDNLTDSVFKNLCKFFIHADSKQQINISYKLRKQWEEVVKRAAGAGSDFQLLKSTRMEMFMLLAPEIMKSLKDFKLTKTSSFSALTIGRRMSIGRKSSQGTPKTGSISERHSERDKDKNLTKLAEVIKIGVP